MNLYFEKIILHNFASYTHAEIDLTEKGFCLVSGRNLYKKDNSYSNGSGKSKIWDGICFTLTGETVKGIKSGLKNNQVEEDSCYTELYFRDDGDFYQIKRIVAPKSDLNIIKNGEDISGKTITESKKKLSEVLPNINKELITAIVLFGQGMPNAFSKLAPSGRKELLEKLTNSDFMIEAIKERTANVSVELNARLRQQEDSILVKATQRDTAINNINSYTDKLATAVKPDFNAKIDAIKVQLAEVNKVLADKKKLQDEASKLLEQKTQELNKLQTDYNESLPAGIQKRAELEANIRSTNNEINKIKNIKEFCPTCGRKLDGVQKPSTDKLEADLASYQETLKKVNAEFDRLAKVYNDEVANINEKYKNIADLSAINREVLVISNQQSSLNNEISKIKAEAETWDINMAKLKEDLVAAKKAKSDLDTELTELNVEKQTSADRVAVLKKIESIVKRDLRGHLLTNIITFINKRSKDFCEIIFKTRDIEIYLDGNDLDITYCGKMFDNLSGGEQMRVDLILQLAIRDMLKSYLNLQSNILVLDEVTDFLDKQSCKAVMELIERELNSVESVFIVSHHAESLSIPIDTELKVEKNEAGISRVI